MVTYVEFPLKIIKLKYFNISDIFRTSQKHVKKYFCRDFKNVNKPREPRAKIS